MTITLLALKLNMIKKNFTSFRKAIRKPSDEQVKCFKNILLNSEWKLRDDVLSTFPSKQLYITVQSLLDVSHQPYMENFQEKASIGNTVDSKFKIGYSLPLGYSLAYCNPLSNETELSPDGYDNYHAPTVDNLEFFKRRMWVSGSFEYDLHNPLRYGQQVDFTETVERVKCLSENGIIFADYKRLFRNESGLSITEKRRLIYLYNTFQDSDKLRKNGYGEPDYTIVVRPSAITNFRMSALTFNSHLIHYNPEYSKKIEGYPNVVVEAPLLIQLALQFWSNKVADSDIKLVNYRITRPVFVDDEIMICMKKQKNFWNVWIEDLNSFICFDATIQS